MAVAIKENKMVFTFRQGTHVPHGVTPEGIMTERQKIKSKFGEVTINTSAALALEHPDEFPMLRACGPTDPDEAIEICLKEGIRKIYGSIVIVHPEAVAGFGAKPVRLLHAVPSPNSPDLSYEELTIITRTPIQREFLLDTLRRDIDVFTEKLKTVIDELAYISA